MGIREEFEAAYPRLQRMAFARFKHLGQEAREEAAAVAVGLAWKYYVRLTETRPAAEARALMMGALHFACKHAYSRDVCGMEKAGDCYRRLERTWSDEGADICDQFADGDDPADKVATRDAIDATLAKMTGTRRDACTMAMLGYDGRDIAAALGVSPSAVSQARRRFAELYAEA